MDKKNRKILYQLDINSRQSYSRIGKLVGLPKTAVAERVKSLQEMGIINSFYTVIDVYKLGYILMRFQYKYQYVTPEIEDTLIQYFVKDKTSTLVASTHGLFNLKVVKVVKNINDFYNLWQDTQRKFGYYFQEKASALFLNEIYYRPSYLLIDDSPRVKREKVVLIGRGTKMEIDESDMDFLRLISMNARMPVTEIAQHLACSVQEATQRLSRLQKIGIIRGFRVDWDIMKLGFHIFRVNVFLNDYTQRQKIIEHISRHPHLIFIDTYTGEADFEFEFHLENIKQFISVMQDLCNVFPAAISHYKYLNVVNYHKFLYLPEK